MAYPKGFIKNLNLNKPKVGPDRRQEMLDDIDNRGTFLPKGVHFEDMDESFVNMVENDLEVIIDGEKVPVIFLTIQRWSEFSKTWQHSDKYKNIKIPFITVVRKPDVQPGTNQAGLWNIPQGRRTYTYVKVPTYEGGRRGVDTYKIPQPTAVDINYEVRLFCNKMKDLNKINTIIQHSFQSRQHYIKPNNHPMPVMLDSVGDESPVDDFENRRFYIQLFEMRLAGYILDEDRFEVIPTVNRAVVLTELDGVKKRKPKFNKNLVNGSDEIQYNLIFEPNTITNTSFVAKDSVEFNGLFSYSVDNVLIKVNGVEVVNGLGTNAGNNNFNKFKIIKGDDVFIDIDKDSNKVGSFVLYGNLI